MKFNIQFSTLFLFGFLFFNSSALAQGRLNSMDPEAIVSKHVDQLTKGIKLDATQEETLEKIEADYAQKIQAAKDSNTRDRSTFRTIISDLLDEVDESLQPTLSDSDYKKLQKQKSALLNRRR